MQHAFEGARCAFKVALLALPTARCEAAVEAECCAVEAERCAVESVCCAVLLYI